MMWLTLIVAETIAAQSGVGYMAMQAREFMQIDVVVLAISIYALLGKLADVVVRALERACLAWHPAFQKIDAMPSSLPRQRIEPRRITDRAPMPHGRRSTCAARQGVRRKSVLRGLDLDFAAGQFVADRRPQRLRQEHAAAADRRPRRRRRRRVAIGEAAPSAEKVARVMFQEPRLLPWASVIANVEVGLGAEREQPAARRRALEALAAVGLADRAHEWPSALSGGQKQRVALARALVSRPRLLALDEPLGALDALTRIEMQRLLERVWRRERFTAILVTHDVAEAVALADRIVLIEQGAIALDVDVDLPRPRQRGSRAFGELEETILERLLGVPAPQL